MRKLGLSVALVSCLLAWGCGSKPEQTADNTKITASQDTTSDDPTLFPGLRADTSQTPSQLIIGHWKQTRLFFDGPLPLDKDEAVRPKWYSKTLNWLKINLQSPSGLTVRLK
jgi:hypothetical protein